MASDGSNPDGCNKFRRLAYDIARPGGSDTERKLNLVEVALKKTYCVPEDNGENGECNDLVVFYTPNMRARSTTGDDDSIKKDDHFVDRKLNKTFAGSHDIFKEWYHGEERSALSQYESWAESGTKAGLEDAMVRGGVPLKDVQSTQIQDVIQNILEPDGENLKTTACTTHPGFRISLGLMQNINKRISTDKRLQFGYNDKHRASDDASVVVKGTKGRAQPDKWANRWVHSHLFLTDFFKFNKNGLLLNFRAGRKDRLHVTHPDVFKSLRIAARRDDENSEFWLEERVLRYLFERPLDLCCIGVMGFGPAESNFNACRCCSNIKELLLSKYYSDHDGAMFDRPPYEPNRATPPARPIKFDKDFGEIPDAVKRELIRPIVRLAVAIANANQNVMVDQADIHRLLLQSSLLSTQPSGNPTARRFTVIVPDHLRGENDLGCFVGEIRFCLGLLREIVGSYISINEHRFKLVLDYSLSKAEKSQTPKDVAEERLEAYAGLRASSAETDDMAAWMKDELVCHYTHDIYFTKVIQQYVFLAIVAEMVSQSHSHPKHLPSEKKVYQKIHDMFFGRVRKRNTVGRCFDMRDEEAVKAAKKKGVYNFSTYRPHYRIARANFGNHSHLIIADRRAPFLLDLSLKNSPGSVPVCYPRDPSYAEEARHKNVIFLTRGCLSHEGFSTDNSNEKEITHQIDTGVFESGVDPADLHDLKDRIRRETHSLPISERTTMQKGTSQNCHVGRWDLDNETFAEDLKAKVLDAVETLRRSKNEASLVLELDDVDCTYCVGTPNVEMKMAVETPHYNGAPSSEESFCVDVFVPCSESGCFVRLFPQLRNHVLKDYHGITVFVCKGSMLVIPGTELRSGGMFTAMDGNPMLHLVVRVKLTRRKHRLSEPESKEDEAPRVPLLCQWQYVLPRGAIISAENAGPEQKQVSIIPPIPQPQPGGNNDDHDRLHWFLNWRFLHLWQSLFV